METEDLFIIVAGLLIFFDLIQLLKAKPREKMRLEYGFYAVTLAGGLIIASYFMLIQAFLTDNFLFKEVYSLSSSGVPVINKIYATWAGTGGSMLFLIFLIASVYFIFRFFNLEKKTAYYIAVFRILDLILVFLLLVVLMNSPFQRLSGKPMDGGGLNPLLQTFWMLIHPPIVFIGYVFVVFAFSFSLAGITTKKNKKIEKTIRICLLGAWLFLTLGIAIGGLWAYEVLGWGGYWAWDPVETASLIPWLTLTALFHLGPSSKQRKNLVKELMILLTFSTTIFTTAITRGGLLVSVHAFGLSPVGPMLILLIFVFIVLFFYLSRKSRKPLTILEIKGSSLYSISLNLGFWSLIIIALICFCGVIFPVIAGVFLSNPFSIGMEFYNTWIFPFALSFIAGLIGCNIYHKIKLKRYFMLIASAACAGLILSLIGQPTPNIMANFGFPLVMLALISIGYNLYSTFTKKKRSYRLLGRTFLHLGVVVTLIGVLTSSTMSQSVTKVTTSNSTINSLGLTIEMKDFTIYGGVGNVHLGDACYPEYSSISIDIFVRQGGTNYQGVLWLHLYTAFGLVSKPLIIPTLEGDLYIHLHQTNSTYYSLVHALLGTGIIPNDAVITIERIPYVYLVWTGVAIMSFGVAIAFIFELIPISKNIYKSVPGTDKESV
jgi:cytochrome c-type biogenesis protein CcmF